MSAKEATTNFSSLKDQRPKPTLEFGTYFQSLKCKQEAVVPKEGVKELANNFFINRMVDELVAQCKVEAEDEVRCDECGMDRSILCCCPDCNMFLCHDCNDTHKCRKKFCSDGVTESTQINVNVALCKVHNTQLRYYCETCQLLVCMYCTVKDHKGHNHDTVMKMAGKYRRELGKITASVKEMGTRVSEARDNVEKMRVKIRQQGEEANKKIEQHYHELVQNLTQIKQQGMCDEVNKGQHYDELFQNLMEHKKQLKQQVDDTVSQKEKAVTTRLEEVEYVQAELSSMDELKDAVEKSSDQDALSAKKHVIDHMQQLADKYKKLNTQPVKLLGIEFVPSKEPFPRFGHLFVHVIDIKHPLAFIDELHTKKLSRNSTSVIPYTTVNKPCKIVRTDKRMDYPWGIEFCENGMWAVTVFTKHCVCLFDNQDLLVRKFGSKGSNDKQFYHPCGVAFENKDHLYVADRDNHRIQKFDISGNYLLMFGGKGSKDGQLDSPCGVTVYKDGVYVADSENGRISVFQLNGQFHRTIGEGQLNSPHDVVVTNNNQLFVADYERHCIYTFTVEGYFVRKFGTKGRGREELCNPRGLTVDKNGFVLVTDKNCRVTIFDKHGNCVHQFGACGSDGGQFYKHSGIALSPNGDIYVCDGGNHRVQIFSTSPKL
ncbi:E3 ubiquitin-protein ligase TRIM71-like [Dysidea avara]|uniref:E3 ubiquitin-protein ligase TRIM71-like n=1 Tax=Dysidea avara TaxID=196820 RepID=UPI0033196F06